MPIANVIVSTPVRSSDPSIESAKDYEFTLGSDHYKLDRSGRFTCQTGSFQLDLHELPYVEELQFVSYSEDVLILLYEVSDGEGGISRVSRVHRPTCELVFTTDLPGFNLGQAVLEGSALYVTVIGFVGRFDVEAWGFDWTHGNLYERYKLNGFGAPAVYRDRVVFPGTAQHVIVEKSSGAMRVVPVTSPSSSPAPDPRGPS